MIRQLYIDHNHITLLVTLLCMVNTPESPQCRPVPVRHIRLPHFAAAIKCRDLVSGIGYSTLPYFGRLCRFWYSALTPSICRASNVNFILIEFVIPLGRYSIVPYFIRMDQFPLPCPTFAFPNFALWGASCDK